MTHKSIVLGLPFVALVFAVGCEQPKTARSNTRTQSSNVVAALPATPAVKTAPDQAPSNNLSDGSTSVAQVAMTADALAVGDASCPAGGQKITAFLSASGHTVFGDGDVLLKTYSVCNGANGTNGSNGTNGTNGSSAPAVILTAKLGVGSAACPAGGLSIETFNDVNGNGSYDAGTDLNEQTTPFCSTFLDVLVNDGSGIAVAKKVDSDAAGLAASSALADTAAKALLAQDLATLTALTNTYNGDQTSNASVTATYNAAVANQAQAQSALDAANAKLTADQASLTSGKATIDVSFFDSKHTFSLTVDADVQSLLALVAKDLSTVLDYSTDSAKTALANQQALVQADMAALTSAQNDTNTVSLTLSSALVDMRAQLALWMNGQPNTYATAEANVQAAYNALSTKNSTLTAASNALNAASAQLAQMMHDKDTWTRDSALILALNSDLSLIRAIACDVKAVAMATSTLTSASTQTTAAQGIKDAADQLVAADAGKVAAEKTVVATDTTAASSAADAKAQALAVEAKADCGITAAQAKLTSDLAAIKAAFGAAVAAQLTQYQSDVAAAFAAGTPLPTPSPYLTIALK